MPLWFWTDDPPAVAAVVSASAAAESQDAAATAAEAAAAMASPRQVFLTPTGAVIVGFPTAQAYAKVYQGRVTADQKVRFYVSFIVNVSILPVSYPALTLE